LKNTISTDAETFCIPETQIKDDLVRSAYLSGNLTLAGADRCSRDFPDPARSTQEILI
jgi:hypothetical protein